MNEQELLSKYSYTKDQDIDLKKLATSGKKLNLDKTAIIAKTKENTAAISSLQDRLYAAGQEGLIIIFQARDAAGKDSCIKHVMSGINPQGVDVYSFKAPSKEELAHDFLWRFNRSLPLRGKIAIFNRSYYEDVLTVKVHKLYKDYNTPKRMKEDDVIDKRFDQIVNYENFLYENGYRIIKIFLNVSAEKQKERFLERISEPDKNWKFNGGDLAERALWDEYTKAYKDVIDKTSTKKAPWYVIPADQKWFARYLVSEAILQILQDMDPQYPELDKEEQDKLQEYKVQLEQEKKI